MKVNLHVFHGEKGKVISHLLDIGTCKSLTAEAIFGNMDKIILETGVL